MREVSIDKTKHWDDLEKEEEQEVEQMEEKQLEPNIHFVNTLVVLLFYPFVLFLVWLSC